MNRRILVALLVGLLVMVFAAGTAFAQGPPGHACAKLDTNPNKAKAFDKACK